MAGYPIGSLKKAEVLNGLDAVPVTQDGITKQVEKSVMDQAVIITQSGAQSSGIIRREGTFVLNSATLINFTLENATGRKTTNNVTADDAASAAGWKIYVFNISTISHTVIHGANSWSIASGETLCFYWTGSKFTLHTEVIQDLTVKGNTKLPNVAAVQSITGSDDLAVIASGGLLKKTTPNDIKTALNLVNTTQLNGALTDYQKLFDSTITDANLAYPSKSGSGLYLCSSNAELVTGYYSMIFSNVVYSGTDYLVKQIAVPYGFGLLNGETWIRNIAYRKGTKTVGNWIKQVTETSLNGALVDYVKYAEYPPNTTKNTSDIDLGYDLSKKNIPVYYSCYFGNNRPVAGFGFFVKSTYIARDNDVLFIEQIAQQIGTLTKDKNKYKRIGSVSGTTVTWGTWEKLVTETDLNGALSNYPFIVNATLSENKTINANSYVDITINYSDVGFTPTKVIVQLSNRISKLAVASVSSVGITSTSCNIRLFNHESVVYNLDASNAKFFVLVQK